MPFTTGRRTRRRAALALATAAISLGATLALRADDGDDARLLANAPDDSLHRETPRDRPGAVPPERPTSPAFRGVRNGFASIQVNVDAAGRNIVGDAANEPSIAVDPTNPLSAAIGWRQFDTIQSDFRQAGWGWTANGGRTWRFPGVIEPGRFRSDPVLDFDANGNFFYNSLTVTDNFECTVFRSSDGGRTWEPGIYAEGGDKQWMAIDRTDGIGRHNIYANWTRNFSRCDGQATGSYDRGESYEPCFDVPFQPQWGTVAVGPDGAVYVAGIGWFIAKSTTLQDPNVTPEFDLVSFVDLGGSPTGGDGPNPGGLLGQAWVAVDHSDGPTRGNVYMLSSLAPPGGDPLDVHFARSTDGGVTWSPPVRVNDVRDGWQWFGTMSVAPNGRIDAIWNDTRNHPGTFLSEVHYAFSLDAGATWSPAVAISPAFDPHVGWPQQNKIGDYYDMVSDRVGATLAYSATFNGEQDVYAVRIGDYDCNGNGTADADDIAGGASDDCNGNGIPDECDIAGGLSADEDGDGVPDECECAGDVDGSGVVDVADVLAVLRAWGNLGGPEDLDGSGVVDLGDLLIVLESWGACPIPSLGACCFDSGFCERIAASTCAARGGIFLGEEAECGEGVCLFGRAAALDGTCVRTSDVRCAETGGTFRGEGTGCDGACGDACDRPIVVGEGSFRFSTEGATSDGPELPPGCDEGSGLLFRNDVWFQYTAASGGVATASVCDSDFNTRLAVYEDGDCPGPFLACNDDACGEEGTRPSLSFPVEAGGVYLVRIGARFATGEGTLVIERE